VVVRGPWTTFKRPCLVSLLVESVGAKWGYAAFDSRETNSGSEVANSAEALTRCESVTCARIPSVDP
jgi:hypothetical protein